jgi:uncharacterized membrane protein
VTYIKRDHYGENSTKFSPSLLETQTGMANDCCGCNSKDKNEAKRKCVVTTCTVGGAVIGGIAGTPGLVPGVALGALAGATVGLAVGLTYYFIDKAIEECDNKEAARVNVQKSKFKRTDKS